MLIVGIDRPKISVITAVYNSVGTIADCIASVQSQSYIPEYIIVDGGSTDGTVDVIKKHESMITKWVSEKDFGIYDALNKGLRMATGDLIGFLHADDLYMCDTTLQTVADCFMGYRVDSCYGDLLYVDRCDSGKVIRHWKSREFATCLLSQGWMPPHPTFFARREIYERFGMFDSSFKIAADYELMMRFLGKHGITTCYIPEVLVKMRVGGASNRSIRNIVRKSSEDYRIMQMHGIGGITTLLRKIISKLPQFFK